MQTQADGKEPPAAGKPPSICDRVQRAFHTRLAFRPLRRLTVRHQDGGAPGVAKPGATGAGAGGAPGATATTHGGPPRPPVPLPPPTPVPSPVGTAPVPTAPLTLPPVANKGDNPQQSTRTVTVTRSNVAEKAAGGLGLPLPVPVPPPAAAGRPPADAKAGDKAQQTEGKSTVRKALSSR